MKILWICPRYEPAHGGAEDYATTISKWLAQNPNNEVEVWTTDALEVDALWFPGKKKVEVLEEVIDGVKVKRFQTTPLLMNNIFINKSIRWLLVHNPIPFLRILGTPPTCFGMWMQIFNKNLPKYDIVHIQQMPYYSLLYIAKTIAKKVGAKLYFSSMTHIGIDKNDPLRDKYFDPIGIEYYLDSDKIFVLTDMEKKAIIDFVRESGKDISEEKFEKVGVGVYLDRILMGNAKRFREKYNLGDTPVVNYIGAKNYVKGTHTLIEAMEILWKKGVKVKLGLSGNPSMEFNAFWNKQSELVKSNTINLDIPTDQEKFDMLAGSDIFTMVSKSESFGIVYLEAWAYKKPVIGANIDILKEIFDVDKDGLLVDFGNAVQLAEKIEYLLNNKQIRDEMGERGYNKVINQHTWDKKFKILEKYFSE